MNIALIFHNYSLLSDKKAQSNSLRNMSLSKQLNGFRLMIVNKKTKPLSFDGKREKCVVSTFFRHINNILKSAKKHYILTIRSLSSRSENKGGLFAYIISSTCSGEGHSGCCGGMRSMCVPGRRPYTGFSVETQGTGAKADIHPVETGLILGTQLGCKLFTIW